MANMNPGDMVWYRQVGRGGYGYERKVQARVVKVFKTRVRIRVGITDDPWNTKAVVSKHKDISVKAYNLAPRDKECGFEDVLKEHPPLAGEGF